MSSAKMLDGSDGTPAMTLDGSDKVGGSGGSVLVENLNPTQDYEAFAAKNLPDLGHEVKDFTAFTWRLSNWKKLDKSLTSPVFECGRHKWRILLYPLGSDESGKVSLFLDSGPPQSVPEGWHECAQFLFVMSNINDPTNNIHNIYVEHRFCAKELDWGYARFRESKDLFTVQDGHTRPIIEEDSVDVTVYVRVVVDATGVLWHNFIDYDSKKETNYVGLKNQGSTGYMNTVLQTLFHNHAFRKAVYEIPTENDEPTTSVALALQRIFYRLQTSKEAVETTELTKSFGWRTIDSFQPGDVVEFYRVLEDKLESIMMGTTSEGTIGRLFVAEMKSCVKCLNVDYESSRIEQFTDLQFRVKGMQNLRDSFRDYVAKQKYTGYMAGKFGLQDAEKGIVFQSFPPVLRLQLARFDYDYQRDKMVKVDDRYEFPLKIDLDEFLDGKADRSSPWVYQLHAVMVHSGNLDGGQYDALIRPNMDNESRWLKFDDDKVIPVLEKEVFEENYGGSLQRVKGQENWSSNAYVLVYIRESAIAQVLAPVPEESIPSHLKKRLDDERLYREQKRKEREEAHLYLSVKIVTDETFACHEGFDLANFGNLRWPSSDLPTFRTLKQENYTTFKGRIAQHFNRPENEIRLWVLVNRQNKTVRPDTPISDYQSNLTMESIRETLAARTADLRFYLEVVNNPSKPERPPQSILIFLKHFDPSKQTLVGAGTVNFPLTNKVADLIPFINKRMHWEPKTPLKLYEEIKPGMIEQMKLNFTFIQSEFGDGDIICFERTLSEKEIRDLKSQELYSTAVEFYDALVNRIMITFKPKVVEAGGQSGFNLLLSKKDNYDIMSTKVGQLLRLDPKKLRFMPTDPFNGKPGAVLKRTGNQSLADIVSLDSPRMPIILYEKSDKVDVTWIGHRDNKTEIHPLVLREMDTLEDLTAQLRKVVRMSPWGTGKIRFFVISLDGKAQTELASREMIRDIAAAVDIYAEEIPRDEVHAQGTESVINVFHFSKDLSRTHNVPFKFVVKFGERFSDTKKRLQARLGISDGEISKYRFALQVSNFKQPLYLEDDDIVYHAGFTPDALGLDHDKEGKVVTRS